IGLAAIFFICPLLYVCFAADYARTYLPYKEVISRLRTKIPATSKVAGPCVLWFAWPESHFRDISALVGSRWMTGGRRDVARWLGGWKPDVIVLETSWKRMLLGPGDTLALLQKALPCRVSPLMAIDTGPGSEGIWEIFTLQWASS